MLHVAEKETCSWLFATEEKIKAQIHLRNYPKKGEKELPFR